MKVAVLVGDGMADWPVRELGGMTPLEAARTPWMDTLAQKGVLGLAKTIPEGFPAGSDIANMVIMGYDPVIHFTGRGPLEAASLGVELLPRDVAFRCNLVHLSLEESSPRMVDFTAGHIPTEISRLIIGLLDERIYSREMSFYPGVSYRHLMVWRNGKYRMKTIPPHDITGQEITAYLPQGDGAERIREIMSWSQEVLRLPEVQSILGPERRNPPNSVWLWGQGLPPAMESLTEKLGIKGAMITAVDLLKGLAKYAGLRTIEVPGATGYLDTDYKAKGRYAIEALKGGDDLVFVHVEAPDEAAHQGSVKEKITAIERFDEEVVGQVLQGLVEFEKWRILVLPDHATPIAIRTHCGDPVPFVVAGYGITSGGAKGFSEKEAERGHRVLDGRKLMEKVVVGSWEGGT